jgi:large subunit ribosomal protein L18
MPTLNHEQRQRRHRRVRQKVWGTRERPRLCVYKSLHHLYAQLVDDEAGHTLVAASTLEGTRNGQAHSNIKSAKALGPLLAERAKALGITQVVFDRGGYPYHGVVKALAESCREGGLKF